MSGIVMINIILILVIILLAVLVFNKGVKSLRTVFNSWKRNMYLAVGYLAVLVIAAFGVYLVPLDDLIGSDMNMPEEIVFPQMNYHAGGNLLHGLSATYHIDELVGSDKTLTQAELENRPGIYKQASHVFEVQDDHQQLKYVDEDTSKRVYVERKPVDDGKVEVVIYATSYLLGNIDITDKILPCTVSFSNGLIKLGGQPGQDLRFKLFKRDFTVNQFGNSAGFYWPSIHYGWQIVLIRIPPSVTLTSAGDAVY